MSSELNGRGSGAAGRALGARARARSLRGDACLCALATVQLEVHGLNLRDGRRVDLLDLVDLLVDVSVGPSRGSLGRCWRFGGTCRISRTSGRPRLGEALFATELEKSPRIAAASA